MSRWLVTQKDHQFGVESLGELKAMAEAGRLAAGDMVQPPGATQWLYASEIPELKARFPDDDGPVGRGRTLAMVGVAGVLLVGLAAGLSLAGYMYTQLPDGTETILGEGGLRYSEMLVTAEGATLKADPVATGSMVAALKKDEVLELLAKRGDHYRARTKHGQEGWVLVSQVLPMYQLGGREAREDYDPLYNPDRYVAVGNAAWSLTEKSDRWTVFQFGMTNASKYPITDLKLLATVKDAKGNELERVEFPVSGIIPPSDNAGPGETMVGTLQPEDRVNGQPQLFTQETFSEMAEEEPELQLRWVDGVEVEMKTRDFAVATVDIVEVRAVPD
jgi:hypothetical protein